MSALVDGTCDVLDPSTRLDGQVGLLQQMQIDNRARLLTAQTNDHGMAGNWHYACLV